VLSAIEEVQLITVESVSGGQHHEEREKAAGNDEDASVDRGEW
jgi:hypothetical protein